MHLSIWNQWYYAFKYHCVVTCNSWVFKNLLELFYLNSTLNFGIPIVFVFQLEVYYKADRLLTGLTAQQKGTTARWYSNKTSLPTFRVPYLIFSRDVQTKLNCLCANVQLAIQLHCGWIKNWLIIQILMCTFLCSQKLFGLNEYWLKYLPILIKITLTKTTLLVLLQRS